MDEKVQRAILLKAIMEALGKSLNVKQAEFYDKIKEEKFRGAWCRYNANSQVLAAGLPSYVESVRAVLDEHPAILPSDPLWNNILNFALNGTNSENPNIMPRPLVSLHYWRASDAHMSNGERHYVTRDMAGCWYIFRLTSKASPQRSVTVSLLNIRPEFFYVKWPSRSIEFSLTARADDNDARILKVQGICRHEGRQLHFLGLLSKRSAPLPTAMAINYDDDDGREGHRKQTEGVLFTTNSERIQIATPVIAVFIDGSQSWIDDDYDKNTKYIINNKLGSFNPSKLNEIMPDGVYQRLMERSRDYVYEAK